jgi:hypothetical protein
VIQNIIADNNGCKVNVDYEPPEDGPVRVETYVGLKSKKVKWCVIFEMLRYVYVRFDVLSSDYANYVSSYTASHPTTLHNVFKVMNINVKRCTSYCTTLNSRII